MSVMPGFGGQEFDESILPKLRALQARDDWHGFLEVDGGIGVETIGQCAAAGADLFVAGTAVFHSSDYAAALRQLRSHAATSTNA
jgi:ribulose-phosphate 3-epimerase